MGFFQGTEELVRNSRGKRAISVRAIEVQLYIHKFFIVAYTYDHVLCQKKKKLASERSPVLKGHFRGNVKAKEVET